MEKSMAPTNEKVSNEKVSNQHIPDHLTFFILSKLPIKSVKRFGCVQKSWAHLFEDPCFMSLYRSNFISKNHSDYDDTCLLLNQTLSGKVYHCVLHLFSGESFENRVKLDWPPPFQDDRHIYILGSIVNGTLCLCQGTKRLVLWNPATEEFKAIPPSPAESLLPYEWAIFRLHGFGYDHARDDYKVIRNVYYSVDRTYFEDYMADLPPDHQLWEIYSLRSNSWRKLDFDLPICRTDITDVCVYLNGLCHWWGERNVNSGEAYLVSFDLSNDTFFTMPLPSEMKGSVDFGFVHRHLVVLNGSIALITNHENEKKKTTAFHISILAELGVKESWTKLFSIGPFPFIMYPIGVGKKGNIFFSKENGKLVWFDLSTQMIEEFGFEGEQFFCQMVVYKKSLLPIKGINN